MHHHSAALPRLSIRPALIHGNQPPSRRNARNNGAETTEREGHLNGHRGTVERFAPPRYIGLPKRSASRSMGRFRRFDPFVPVMSVSRENIRVLPTNNSGARAIAPKLHNTPNTPLGFEPGVLDPKAGVARGRCLGASPLPVHPTLSNPRSLAANSQNSGSWEKSGKNNVIFPVELGIKAGERKNC